MTSRPRSPRRLGAGLLCLLVGAVLTVLTAAPAAAHTRLVSSAPADGATVGAAPAELVLTFSEPVLGLGAVVVVSDDGGARPPVVPQVAGTEVTADLPDDLAGQVRVAWRVTAGDGHPISGEVAFDVAAAAPPVPTAQEPVAPTDPSAPAGDATSPGSTTPASTGPAPATVPATSEPVARTGGGGLPVGWLLAGTLAVVALAAAGVLLARRGAGSPRSGP